MNSNRSRFGRSRQNRFRAQSKPGGRQHRRGFAHDSWNPPPPTHVPSRPRSAAPTPNPFPPPKSDPPLRRRRPPGRAPVPATLPCAPNETKSPDLRRGRRGLQRLLPCPTRRHKAACPCPTRDLVIGDEPEGAPDGSFAAYAEEKKRTGRRPRRTRPPPPTQGGQRATSSDISPIPPITAKYPLPATAITNYWDALGLDFDDDAEFRSEINLNHPHKATIIEGGRIDLARIKTITNN